MLLTWLLSCRSPEPAPSGAEVSPLPPATRVLLVSIDTLRADHLDAWGGSLGLSPAIDRFVSGSLQFTRAYAQAPWTKPSMTTVMTSLLPRDHAVTSWRSELAPEHQTLAALMQQAGWRTEAYVVQGAFLPRMNEFERGFDVFELAWPGGGGEVSPEELETSAYLTDMALPALQRLQEAGDPFLLWVHYFDPHRRYLPHEAGLALGEDEPSLYAGEVGWTDTQLDRLLEVAVQDPSLVIVLLADHGEELEDHGGWGHAHTLYEELIHVPLALRVPGLPAGADDTPVGLVDVAPTLLSLAGLPQPAALQGQPLLPAPSARPVLSETDEHGGRRGSIEWPWKLVWDLEQRQGELYELEADPGERQDLWLLEPERAQAQLQRLAEAYPEILTD
jgi:choline-sulfatase